MGVALELLVGWLLLWKGGDYLVDGADRFARGRGMPSSLAGVFILGFGTSAPELVTTVLAALRDLPGIAAGNVVGSNIANVGLILGAAALLGTVVVDPFLRKIEIPLAVAASVLAFALMLDGRCDLGDGLVLLLGFAGYTAFAVATARKRPAPPPPAGEHRPALELATAALGLGGLVLGAHLFLEGAVEVAAALGVSQTVIGLSLVAVGTSLPELATTIAAARAGRMELAVGNVVGSNIFNLGLVLGTAGVIRTQHVGARMARIDLPVMLGFAVLCLVFAWRGRRITRRQGALLLVLYAAYVGVLVLTAAP